MTPHRRSILLVGVIAALAIAIPVMGADPPPSAGPSASADASPSTSPDASSSAAPTATSSTESAQPSATPATVTAPRPDRTPDPVDDSESKNRPKTDKEPGIPVTVTGTVTRSTDGQGRPTFTLTAGTTTWELSAGPPWYWGDKNPLAAYVGKSVTVVGEAEQGGTEIDVDTVDGKPIRAPGKPPWAGGPWAVGPTHPGWKSWMANGKPGKGHADGAKEPEASPGS